jgi:hypothetical protein
MKTKIAKALDWIFGSLPGYCPIHGIQMHAESFGFAGYAVVCDECQAVFGRQATREEKEHAISTCLQDLYTELSTSPEGEAQQVISDAEIDGYSMHIQDTSFGDGPTFSIRNSEGVWAFHVYSLTPGNWTLPVSINATSEDLEWICPLVKRATIGRLWVDKLKGYRRGLGYQP